VVEIADVNIHIYMHDEFSKKIDEVLRMLRTLTKVEVYEMATLDELQVQVASNTDVVQSAVVLIAGLADQLQAAATDPAAVQALAEQLRSNNQVLADAVAANTVVAPAGPSDAAEGGGPVVEG
jgi:hypothetical protein